MVPLLVETPEFKMQYVAFGSGEKPLVILPGLSIKSVMESADMVEQSYSIFSKEFRVYLFDRRLDLPEEYPPQKMAEDTAEAMKALGLSKVCLYGVSQGGMMAQFIALWHPELVEKLALCSTNCGITKEQAAVFKMYEDKLSGDFVRSVNAFPEEESTENPDHFEANGKAPLKEEGGEARTTGEKADPADSTQTAGTLMERIRKVFTEFSKMIYTKAFYEKFETAIEEAAKTITKEEAERFLIFLRNIGEFTISDELHKIKCPVLALCGSEDKLITPDCAQLIAEKTGGELEIYNGFGHAVYDEAPEIKKKLYDFFTSPDNKKAENQKEQTE